MEGLLSVHGSALYYSECGYRFQEKAEFPFLLEKEKQAETRACFIDMNRRIIPKSRRASAGIHSS